MSPVKYEPGFISHKTTFFIVTAVETSNVTQREQAGLCSGVVMCLL
jgi:hypothetical protein